MKLVENREFELLVKSVLEAEYKVKLVTDSTITTGGATYSYDLANIEQEVYIEIKHRHAPQDRGGILQSIQGRFSVVFNGDKEQLFILVFAVDISQEDKNYYVGSFKLGGGVGQLKVFDRNDIMLLAEKHNTSSEKTKTAPENVEATIKIKDDGVNIVETFLKNKQRSFFAVGHLWNNNQEDQMPRFIERGLWENGYETKNEKTVNSVKEGDVVFLKSTYATKTEGILRVKAIGLVTGNPKDGHLLSVNWHLINQIDLPKLGAYRDTITRIGDENVTRILEGLYKQLPDVFEIIERLDRLILSKPKPIVLDIKPFSEKNAELVKDTEFHFQKAVDVLEALKTYDDINDGFVELKEIKRASSVESSSYIQLNTHWKNRGDTTPKQFIAYLKKHQSDLIPLYELISKFISYVDRNAWNKDVFNEYEDNRVIAKTGVRQTDLVSHFLDFALNGFEIEPNREGFVLSNAIEYLKNPSEKFNILSKKHIVLISEYFLGAIYSGDEFHSKLKNYFEQEYQLSVVNLKNLTCFYTIIIYDPSIRKLWETNKIGTGGGGGNPPSDDDGNEDNEGEENNNDKIPFHLDQVVDEDKLGREPVAKAFVDLIKNDIFKPKLNHSFMVHLQGKWGTGKSSFLNFIKKHLNEGNEKWVIINYNAWQNQHINPPWWTLLDQIYQQSVKGKNLRKDESFWWEFQDNNVLWWKEKFRRIIRYSSWKKIISLLLTLLFGGLLVMYGNSILEIIVNTPAKNESIDNVAKGLTLEVFAKLIVTIGSTVGVLFSLSKFISTPFFIQSSGDATSFMHRAADPMAKIKGHFNKLVDDINSKYPKRQLAIFIDDIDRCNKEFIVELLEGIQTLFKEKRVLYIVAGDKKWITTSFGNTYSEFVEDPKSYNEKNELGELFLEKAFQLSFRMPNVSEAAKKEYWNHLLGIKEEEEKRSDSVDQLNESQKKELEEELKLNKARMSEPEFMKGIEDKYSLTGDTVSNIVIEEKNKDSEEIRHLLKDFHSLIDSNPRSIIRLANSYTMIRSTLIAERRSFNTQKLFRWLILEDKYPPIESLINNSENMESVIEQLDGVFIDTEIERFKTLLLDEQDEYDGPLTKEEINTFIG